MNLGVDVDTDMGPIARGLENTLLCCADERTWVHHTAGYGSKRCVNAWATAFGVNEYLFKFSFRYATRDYGYGICPQSRNHVSVNDEDGQQAVIWMLEEALDEAIELGI